MSEKYGVYDWLRSINQLLLKDDRTCYMVSGMNIILNLFPDVIWDEDWFQSFYDNEYYVDWKKVPLPKSWAPGIAWAKRVLEYVKKKLNKKISLRQFDFHSEKLNKYLDEWRLVAVNINMNPGISYELSSGNVRWPFQRPFSSWHWILLWKDREWLFLLNSWEPKTNKSRIDSLEVLNLFKGWQAYTFIPNTFDLAKNK